ncbi:YeeE/YedE thiosulfate transporter family protein [Sneathiella aquimaris]
MLLSFIKASVWILGITLILTEVFSLYPLQAYGWQASVGTMIGGLIFGTGAALNGGCAVSTLTRLGNGNLGKLLTLAGFFIGVLCFDFLQAEKLASAPLPAPTIFEITSNWKIWLAGSISLWMCWELGRLMRTHLNRSFFRDLIAPRYKLSSAAFIIGASNGFLFFLYGIWLHTRLMGEMARHLVFEAPSPDPLLGILFFALLTGISISALHSRRFYLEWQPNVKWLLYFTGGIFMGIGSAVMPGGNDVIWLSALPSLSLHAVPAIFSILVGIAVTLFALRYVGLNIQHVDCRGDMCKVGDTP